MLARGGLIGAAGYEAVQAVQSVSIVPGSEVFVNQAAGVSFNLLVENYVVDSGLTDACLFGICWHRYGHIDTGASWNPGSSANLVSGVDNSQIRLWYLLNPTPGTGTVTFSGSGSNGERLAWVFLCEHVKQTTPIVDIATEVNVAGGLGTHTIQIANMTSDDLALAGFNGYTSNGSSLPSPFLLSGSDIASTPGIRSANYHVGAATETGTGTVSVSFSRVSSLSEIYTFGVRIEHA